MGTRELYPTQPITKEHLVTPTQEEILLSPRLVKASTMKLANLNSRQKATLSVEDNSWISL